MKALSTSEKLHTDTRALDNAREAGKFRETWKSFTNCVSVSKEHKYTSLHWSSRKYCFYEKYTYELGTPGPHNVRALSYRERSMVVSNYDRASLENKRSLTRSSERLFSSSELGRDRHKQHRVNLSACKSRKIVISSPHSQMGSYLVSRLAAGYQYAKYGAYAS